MAVAVGGSLKTRGSLWSPEDVFIVQAAVGRVSYRQAGTVRTGPAPPPAKLQSGPGGFVCCSEGKRSAGRSEHSQLDFTKDTSVRTALALVPQSGLKGGARFRPCGPIGWRENASTTREKKAVLFF